MKSPAQRKKNEMQLIDKIVGNAQQGAQYEIVLVTPSLANEWLNFNTNNRRINPQAVAKLVSDIRNGRWQNNGESIKFDRENRLIDGQHRLLAIIASGISLRLLVVTNLEPGSQQTIDIGVSRTSGQIAGMLGVANAHELAALAHVLLRYERSRDVIWNASASATKTEIVEFVTREASNLNRANSFGNQARRAARIKSVPYSLLAFHVLNKYDEGTWMKWHDRIVDGVGLSQTDARLVLRNQSMRRDSARQGSWPQQEMIGWVIKAWNAYVTNRPIKALIFRKDELPMPLIK
jgi:hypothetical protein